MSVAGLVNQYYSHIAAFILAFSIAAEVVLPPALMRNSFGSPYSALKEVNQVTWGPVSSDQLLDVRAIKEAWQALGIAVHEVRGEKDTAPEKADLDAFGTLSSIIAF